MIFLSGKNIFIILFVCILSLTLLGTASADDWYTINMPLDHQENDHYCGPASLRMIGLSWGVNKSQSTIASYAGTNADGTGHSGLQNAASCLFGASYSEWLWSDVYIETTFKDNLLAGKRYIFHVMTGTLKTDAYGNKLWQGDFGHYITVKGVNPSKKFFKINDPTKGTVDLTYDQLKGATADISQKSVLRFAR